MLTVVCLKWGTSFPSVHVNVLYQAVKRNLGIPFRFVCLTDQPAGIAEGIDTMPIPEMGLEPGRWRHGCWPKLSIFKRGLFPDAEIVVYFDLDLIIQAPLEPFIDRVRASGGLHITREWNPALWSLAPIALRPDRGAQGAFMAFRPEDMHYVYDDFMADQQKAFALAKDDQVYLSRTVKNRQYWPHGWCVSFKRTCLWYYPFNLVFRKVSRPMHARIIIFHGQPRPWDLILKPGKRWGTKRKFGTEPVEWVKDYYRLAGERVD